LSGESEKDSILAATLNGNSNGAAIFQEACLSWPGELFAVEVILPGIG
jgi:hypothetical protein